eukprot:476877-Pelagomonas_calceolata.AAC.1
MCQCASVPFSIASSTNRECSRFRALHEPFDDPTFLSAITRAYHAKEGVDEEGNSAVIPLIFSLEQHALVGSK